jgi:hypothetical protein
MTEADGIVFVVDYDASVRQSLKKSFGLLYMMLQKLPPDRVTSSGMSLTLTAFTRIRTEISADPTGAGRWVWSERTTLDSLMSRLLSSWPR